jgi:hypothetical protein
MLLSVSCEHPLSLSRFRCLQLLATSSNDSSVIFLQFVMLRPCSRTAFFAKAFMVRSVMASTLVTSSARRLLLSSNMDTRLKSVNLVQLVRVNRSTRLHTERGPNVPSLTSLPSADRFRRLIRLLYSKKLAVVRIVCMTLFTLAHLFVDGRCQSRPTLFRDQSFETSIQFLRSAGEDSFAKTAIISSAGRRDMGETRFCSSMARRRASSSESGETEGASEERESLEFSMIESLSSSKPRSGEVDAEESDREALVSRSCLRERDMAACCLRVLLRVQTGSLERSFIVVEVA